MIILDIIGIVIAVIGFMGLITIAIDQENQDAEDIKNWCSFSVEVGILLLILSRLI